MSEGIVHAFYILTEPENGTWLDVTDDVLYRGRRWTHGIMSTHPLEKIASVGTAQFMLRNDSLSGTEYRYTPGHANCISGFSTKTKVKITATWSGHTKTVFLGWIPPDGIVQPYAANQANIVSVVAYDFMYMILNHTVTLAEISTDKTLGQVAEELLDLLEVGPSRVDYGNFSEEFESTNETVRENTSVYAELNKAVLSEMGYAYLKYEHDSGADDILVIEGRNDRNAVTKYSIVAPGDGEGTWYLNTEAGERLNWEIADDPVIYQGDLVAEYMISFDKVEDVMRYGVVNGAHFTNRVLGKCYPKKVGTTTEVYRMVNPLSLKAGETRENLRIRYLVEDGYVAVAATNVGVKGTPTMFSDRGGTATDLTADLTVSGTYGAADAYLTLENSGTVDGYVIGASGDPGLYLEGDPIYIGDTITQVINIPTAGAEYYGKLEMVLDQKYQSDPERNYDQIAVLASRYSERINTIQDIVFCANTSSVLAGLYILNDVGSKIPLNYQGAGIEDDYFIQGIEVWQEGTATYCRFIVKSASYDSYSFWELGVTGASELGETTVLGVED